MRAPSILLVTTIAACSPFSSTDASSGDAGVNPASKDASSGDAGVSPGSKDASSGDAGVSPAPFASDAFSRAIAVGFGDADLGGPWKTTASPGALASVGEGTGNVLVKAEDVVFAYLEDIAQLDVDQEATFESAEFGNPASVSYLSLSARRNGTTQYACTGVVQKDGEVTLTIASSLLGGATIIGTTSGFKVTSNEGFRLRFVVEGKMPTKLRCKAWRTSSAEPSGWQAEANDATTTLQAAGNVGMRVYLSGSATLDTIVHIDDYVARPPGKP